MDFPTYNSNNIHQQQRNNNYQRLQTPQYLPHPGNYGYQQQFNQMNYQPPPLPLPMQPQNNFQSHSQYRPPFHPRNGNHLQQHPNHPNHNRPNQIQYANNNQHNIVQVCGSYHHVDNFLHPLSKVFYYIFLTGLHFSVLSNLVS